MLGRFRLEKVVRPSDRTPILAGGGGHPGDTRGAGRRREGGPRRGRASAELMLRATREARCDLRTCSEPKGWPTAPTAPGGLVLVSNILIRAYAVESLHCVARRAGDKPRSLANSKVKVNFKGFSQTPFLAFVWLERAYTQ